MRAAPDTRRFFLREGDEPWHEVTKREWVAAERRAGFHNTMGQPDEPGTAAFSTTAWSGIRGRYVTENSRPDQYDWDPAYRDAVWPKDPT